MVNLLRMDSRLEYIKELAKKIYDILEDSTNRYDTLDELEDFLDKVINKY